MLLYLLGSSANTNPIYPIEDETRAYSLSYSFGRRLRLVSASSASVHDLLDHEFGIHFSWRCSLPSPTPHHMSSDMKTMY